MSDIAAEEERKLVRAIRELRESIGHLICSVDELAMSVDEASGACDEDTCPDCGEPYGGDGGNGASA